MKFGTHFQPWQFRKAQGGDNVSNGGDKESRAGDNVPRGGDKRAQGGDN